MATWRETSVGGAPADGRSATAQAACWDREAGKPASLIQRVWGPGGQSPDPVLWKYPPLVESEGRGGDNQSYGRGTGPYAGTMGACSQKTKDGQGKRE
ncbi:hypothetical protein HPB47_015662 [Ixodes persulcatus]|uniref:Uncharacterized protein n=1 Tax=Ixodes persulcatus TaxID=34615 RepID=A0AC60QWH7_IXOPE|nr:hypothetical protein HPB47_015662 [Ixodes persulcatus]